MLKEQVITPRVGSRSSNVATAGNQSSSKSGDFVQRPAARNGRAARAAKKPEWSFGRVLTYVPLFLKIVLVGCILFVAVIGYRAAAAAPFFQMQNVDISGNRRTQSREVDATVKKHAARAGVWRADIEAIKNDLERMTWVRSATVARVLPSGIRVRIAEREPHLVVRTENGRLMWADNEGMLLGAVSPNDEMPPYFVRGVEESNTEDAKRRNRERVAKYNEMRGAWDTANLTARVSEVNLDDLNDVRAQLAGNDSGIEVRLGGQDFGKRLQRAVRVLDQAKQTPEGARITRLDAASNQSHIIIGTSNGVERSSNQSLSANATNDVAATAATTAASAARDNNSAREASSTNQSSNANDAQTRNQSARRANEEKKNARATNTPRGRADTTADKRTQDNASERRAAQRARVVNENSTRGRNERPRRAANGEG